MMRFNPLPPLAAALLFLAVHPAAAESNRSVLAPAPRLEFAPPPAAEVPPVADAGSQTVTPVNPVDGLPGLMVPNGGGS